MCVTFASYLCGNPGSEFCLQREERKLKGFGKVKIKCSFNQEKNWDIQINEYKLYK